MKSTAAVFSATFACASVLSAAQPDVVDSLMAKYDTNADGKWSAVELAAYLQAEGPLSKAFDKMNIDRSNDHGQKVVTARERDSAVAKQGTEDLPKYEISPDGLMDKKEAINYFKDTNKGLADALEEERKKLDPFLRIFGEGFRVRNSLLVDQNKIDRPMILGFARDVKTSTTSYFLDGAMQYEFDFANGIFAPTIEAHISDDAKATRDAVIVATPFWWSLSPGAAEITELGPDGEYHSGDWNGISHTFQVTPQYIRDRVGDVELLQMGLAYTPDIPFLGIGNSKLLGGRLTWRPWFGLDYAHAIETTPATLAKIGNEDMFRPYVRIGASLQLIPQRWVLTGNATLRHEGGGLERNLYYWGLSSDIFLDMAQHFSINVSYEHGRNEPKFDDVEFLRAGFGLRF